MMSSIVAGGQVDELFDDVEEDSSPLASPAHLQLPPLTRAPQFDASTSSQVHPAHLLEGPPPPTLFAPTFIAPRMNKSKSDPSGTSQRSPTSATEDDWSTDAPPRLFASSPTGEMVHRFAVGKTDRNLKSSNSERRAMSEQKPSHRGKREPKVTGDPHTREPSTATIVPPPSTSGTLRLTIAKSTLHQLSPTMKKTSPRESGIGAASRITIAQLVKTPTTDFELDGDVTNMAVKTEEVSTSPEGSTAARSSKRTIKPSRRATDSGLQTTAKMRKVNLLEGEDDTMKAGPSKTTTQPQSVPKAKAVVASHVSNRARVKLKMPARRQGVPAEPLVNSVGRLLIGGKTAALMTKGSGARPIVKKVVVIGVKTPTTVSKKGTKSKSPPNLKPPKAKHDQKITPPRPSAPTPEVDDPQEQMELSVDFVNYELPAITFLLDIQRSVAEALSEPMPALHDQVDPLVNRLIAKADALYHELPSSVPLWTAEHVVCFLDRTQLSPSFDLNVFLEEELNGAQLLCMSMENLRGYPYNMPLGVALKFHNVINTLLVPRAKGSNGKAPLKTVNV